MAAGASPTAILGLLPGANVGGSNVGMPSPATGGTTPALGGGGNPLVPSFPSGQAFPANMPGGTTAGLPGMNFPQIGGTGGTDWWNIRKSFEDAGLPSGEAMQLASFLTSGAGFSPEVLSAIWNSLQPQMARSRANIMEQFGAQGLRFGSPAAIGLGDFESQATLGFGQIAANMYGQAVRNYEQALFGGIKAAQDQPHGGGLLDSILDGLGSIFGMGTGGGGTLGGDVLGSIFPGLFGEAAAGSATAAATGAAAGGASEGLAALALLL